MTRGRETKSKSVPRAKLENCFAENMKASKPAERLFEFAKAMLRDASDKRYVIAQSEKTVLRNQLDDINRQIESLLDRVVLANNASVVSAYEDKIDKLERDKIVLQEKIDKAVPDKGLLEDCIKLSSGFLTSPWNICKNGNFTGVSRCFDWHLQCRCDASPMECIERRNSHFRSDI